MTRAISLKSKLFALIAATALAMCILPASAFASTINIYDDTSGVSVTPVATIETTGTGAVSLNPGELRALYYKSGWKVLVGSDYLPLATTLSTKASAAWTACDYITFDVTDDGGVTFEPYIKYNNGHFTKSEVSGLYYFYPLVAANSSNTIINDPTGANSYSMVLAYTWGSGSAGSGAGGASVSTDPHNYPRVLWGLSGTTGFNAAGNRLPSNIYAIHLCADE